jgi:glycosyltransferase involved in cell wall biosynthesis
MKVSLVISTYNRPEALGLCLQSIRNQVVLPDEVIIGDDGSGDETRKLIEQFQADFPVPIIHIWQDDKGFRLAESRNKAIVASMGGYIIQIDGDIIMHKDFISDHLRFASRGVLLQGSRVKIGREKTKRLIAGKGKFPCFWSCGLQRRENAIHCLWICRLLLERYRNPFPFYYARGCNMSFFYDDFVAVNGYDESFVDWGHEDSDLTLRMIQNGVKKKSLKFSAIAYHLYHKELQNYEETPNKKRMDEHLHQQSVWCEKGIQK